jgi:hypothetical protein
MFVGLGFARVITEGPAMLFQGTLPGAIGRHLGASPKAS